MNLAVRAASASADKEEMIALLERNFPGHPMRDHFQHHEDNPAGGPWSWVIYDRESGSIGAMTSLFRRPMYVDGKLLMCGQVGQFAVDKAYRSLGPALKLQRATFQPVDSDALAFCYDCPPHDEGRSTFTRLGMRSTCEFMRYAFLLRSDQFLERRLGKAAWTRPLITGSNLLLNLRRARRGAPGIEICNLVGRFDDEFTHMDRIVPSTGIVRSSRSAESLNWRYRDNALSKVRVVLARQGGELVAFLAFSIEAERTATIHDLFGRNLDQAGLPLLDAMIDACRQEEAVRIDGCCSETSELGPLFRTIGFRRRERAATVFAYAKPGAMSHILISQESWPLGQAELGD